MKKLFALLLLAFSTVSYSQIMKTGGLLYSNGNPNTRGIDTLVTKNLSKNSEVCVDYSTGTIYTFDRSDSSFVKYDSRPYKVYTALLTQSGTNAPVATVLENTLGDTVVWTREYVGHYSGTLTGAFTLNKTATFITTQLDESVGRVSIYSVSVNAINIYTSDYSIQVDADSELSGTTIEIRVYN